MNKYNCQSKCVLSTARLHHTEVENFVRVTESGLSACESDMNKKFSVTKFLW